MGSKDEKKKLIEKAGMLLTDEELDKVAGGWDGEGAFPGRCRCTCLVATVARTARAAPVASCVYINVQAGAIILKVPSTRHWGRARPAARRWCPPDRLCGGVCYGLQG